MASKGMQRNDFIRTHSLTKSKKALRFDDKLRSGSLHTKMLQMEFYVCFISFHKET